MKLHQRIDRESSNPMTTTDPREVHSVVLLTDDRNLRVKAHASHLPVKNMHAFISLLETQHS